MREMNSQNGMHIKVSVRKIINLTLEKSALLCSEKQADETPSVGKASGSTYIMCKVKRGRMGGQAGMQAGR